MRGRGLLAFVALTLLLFAVHVESAFGQAAINLAQLNGTISDATLP